VVHQWEAGHQYSAGDVVAYGGNYYIANTDFTSSTSFETDLSKWNATGGKDAKYDISQIAMDNKTLTKVAIGSDVVGDADKNHTLATVGYIEQALAQLSFDGSKPITRQGWLGVTGFTPSTDNVADFLKKIFYPPTSALITSFNYNGIINPSTSFSYQITDGQRIVTNYVGTISIPYSTWNTTANLTFNYAITNRSVSDESDDTPIQKVELFLEGTNIGINTVNSTAATVSGSFSPLSSSFSTGIKHILNLRVTDGASNIVSLNLFVILEKAN